MNTLKPEHLNDKNQILIKILNSSILLWLNSSNSLIFAQSIFCLIFIDLLIL